MTIVKRFESKAINDPHLCLLRLLQLKSPGSEGDGEPTKGVEYRLVPDTRDLLGARMLLTMNPEDGEKLKAGEAMTPEIAQAAIKKGTHFLNNHV